MARDVRIRIEGDSSGFSDAVNQADRDGNRLSGLFRGVGVAAAAGATAVVGIGVALYNVGSQFDDAYDTIRTATGATGEALGDLEESFRNVVTSVPASFEDASSAIADLNSRLHLTGEPLEALSSQFLNLANVTGGDLSAQIEAGTRALGDWSFAAEDQAEALDHIFRASQQTGTSFDQLAQSVTQFGGPLRQLGFSFDESLALIGQFNAQGVNTELVLGSMRQALGRMARAGEAPIETLQRTMEAIENAGTAGEANALALELFGARAGPDMAAAIREGRFAVDDLVASIAGGGDTINQAAADTADFAEQWTLFKNRILVALEPIAMRVFNGVGEAMTRVGPYVQRFAAWFNEALPQAMAALGDWWDDNGPQIVDAVSSVFDSISSAVQAFSGWWQDQWPAIRSAVDGVVSWFQTEAQPRIDEFLGYVQQKISGFRDWWTTNWTAIREALGHILVTIQALWRQFGDDILNVVRAQFEFVKETIENAMQVIRGIVETVIHLINGDWGLAWESFKQIPEAILAQLLNSIDLGLTQIRILLSLAWDLIGQGVAAAWDQFKETIRTKWDDILVAMATWPGMALLALAGLAVELARVGHDAVMALRDAAVDWARDHLLPWFERLPGMILRAVGDLGRVLYDVGRDVIDGFIDGLRSRFSAVQGALGGLTSSLTSWKGPPEVDRQILRPAGRMVIEGFNEGLRGTFPETRSTLRGLTGALPSFAAAGGTGGGSPTINVYPPPGTDGEQIAAALARYIRRGGHAPWAA